MAIPGAGASFKIASATNVLTEIATWLNDISGDDSVDETDGSTFSPGALIPTKSTLFGAVERTITVSGRWSPASSAFFQAISGQTNKAFEWSPEGTATGKLRYYGSLNVGPWPTPSQSVDGVIGFTVTLKVNAIDSETIATPPASVAITSSSVADPTVLTTAAHSIPVGASRVVTIAGHSGSTPSLNGTWYATALTSTTVTIPVAVTVGGTGGTLQD